MLSELYEKRMSRGDITLDGSYMRLVPVQLVQDGVVVRTSEFQRFTPMDEFKEFVYTDFSIDNILATGSTNLLKPVSMVNHDFVGFAQGLDDLNTKLNGNEEIAQ